MYFYFIALLMGSFIVEGGVQIKFYIALYGVCSPNFNLKAMSRDITADLPDNHQLWRLSRDTENILPF